MIAALKRNIANMTSDQKFATILTGSAYSLGARILTACLNLATSVIIARYYGASALGLLAMLTSLFSFVIIFTVMGTNVSTLRLIPEHIAKYSVTSAFKVFRKIQYSVAALSIVTSLLLFFMSDVLAEKIFSKPHLSYLIALSAGFVLCKSLLDLNTEAIRSLKLLKVYAAMQTVPALLFLLLLLGGMPLHISANMPVYAQLTAWALAAIIGLWVVNRTFKAQMQTDDKIRQVKFKEILGISAPMMMTASMHFFIGQISIILLGIFRTEVEVGYYSVAVRLSTLTVFILGAINSMAAPRFSELFHAGKIDELFHVAKKSTKLIFWTTTPILIFLIVLGKPFLSLVFGEEYTLAYPAMVLLTIGQFVNAISGSTGYFMSMTGHQKQFMNIVLIAATISITGNLLLIPKIGIIGAAFSSMTTLSFMNLYTLYYIRKKFKRSICYIPNPFTCKR